MIPDIVHRPTYTEPCRTLEEAEQRLQEVMREYIGQGIRLNPDGSLHPTERALYLARALYAGIPVVDCKLLRYAAGGRDLLLFVPDWQRLRLAARVPWDRYVQEDT